MIFVHNYYGQGTPRVSPNSRFEGCLEKHILQSLVEINTKCLAFEDLMDTRRFWFETLLKSQVLTGRC